MRLKFPPLSGGTSIGLNDPGIETFEGNYAHYIVRETAQNSLDAAVSDVQPVRLHFQPHSFDLEDIGFHSDLLGALHASKSFWPMQKKAQIFFNRGLSEVDQSSVTFLRISDYGTTGVPGDDVGHDSPWYGLVKSRGVSVKDDDGSGGSFGIGKDAPLAGSACRTVLYSSRTSDGHVAFQGVSRLVTHLANGEETQGTGFVGNYDEGDTSYPAIREESEIPELFRRRGMDPGLDIWIVAFKYSTEEWQQLFVAAALANFWPAIHFGRIEFKIGDELVNHDTLPELMNRMENTEPVKSQLPFFQALVSPDSKTFTADVPVAGRCSLHVITGQHLPRRIAMTRKTGMIIYPAAFRVLRMPFSGLFICNSDKGNALLKTLEPPSHDKWDGNRNQDEPDAGKSLANILNFIRESLRSLAPDVSETSLQEDMIARYIHHDDDESELPDPALETGGETDISGRPDSVEGPATGKPAVAVVLKKDTSGNAGGEDGEGGGGSDYPNGKDGDGENTGGKRGSGGNESGGGGGGSSIQPAKPQIASRGWEPDDSDWDYDMILRTRKGVAYKGGLLVTATDEEGSEEEVAVEKAALIDSGLKLETVGNEIRGVQFSEDQAVKVRIKLAAASKLALRVKPA